jgi:hypothetical protein
MATGLVQCYGSALAAASEPGVASAAGSAASDAAAAAAFAQHAAAAQSDASGPGNPFEESSKPQGSAAAASAAADEPKLTGPVSTPVLTGIESNAGDSVASTPVSMSDFTAPVQVCAGVLHCWFSTSQHPSLLPFLTRLLIPLQRLLLAARRMVKQRSLLPHPLTRVSEKGVRGAPDSLPLRSVLCCLMHPFCPLSDGWYRSSISCPCWGRES